MSFSGDVKKELLSVLPKRRCCRMAELSAMAQLSFSFENSIAAEKFFTLSGKAFNIDVVAKYDRQQKKHTGCTPTFITEHLGEDVLIAMRNADVLTKECCRRAFLRGAFLAAGSISTPEKYYHLEIVCQTSEDASLLQRVMKTFALDPKIVQRKGDFVVYLKEGEQIVTMLGEMGASVSFLNLESIRVMKEMRGFVNRKVNCETANLNKTVISAVRQMEDIRLLEECGVLQGLKAPLRQMAQIRLKYPQAPLGQLGQYLTPPIGKSGVNHRLKKISEIAAELRESTGMVL